MFKTEGWTGSKVKCDLCAHEWMVVHFITMDKLRCPCCENLAYFEFVELEL